jgi:hypothetical protein
VNPPPAVPTTRVAPRRPGVRRLALVAAALVALSVVRPWGDGSATQPSGFDAIASAAPGERAAAEAAVTARETGPPAAVSPSVGPDEIACAPTGWRLVTLEDLGPWTVRSWTPASAVLASGPLDPTIPTTAIASEAVLAMGACSPATFDDSGRLLTGGPTRILRAWRIDSGRATEIALGATRPEATPGIATLYLPDGARDDAWPTGTFVVQVALTTGSPTAINRLAEERGPLAWYLGVVVGRPG